MTQTPQENPAGIIKTFNAEFLPPLQSASAALFRAQCVERAVRADEHPEDYRRATHDRAQIQANRFRVEALRVHMPALLASVRNGIAQTEPYSEERRYIVDSFLEQFMLIRNEFQSKDDSLEFSADTLVSMPAGNASTLTDDMLIGDLGIWGPSEPPTDYSGRFVDAPEQVAFSSTIRTRVLKTLLGRNGQMPDWIADLEPIDPNSDLGKALSNASSKELHLLLSGSRRQDVTIADEKDVPLVLRHPDNPDWYKYAQSMIEGAPQEWQARLAQIVREVIASLPPRTQG